MRKLMLVLGVIMIVALLLQGGATVSVLAAPTEWSVPMTATTATEGSNTNLEFGTRTGAADGYDSSIDQPHPPPGPGVTFDAYFSIVDPIFPELDKDYRGEADSIQWKLQADSSSEDIMLTWNVSGVPANISLRLTDTGIDIDMKAVASTVLGAGTYSLTITATTVNTPGGGTAAPDTRAPVISNAKCSDCTKTSIIIKWKTNEHSTSQVEYWASEHIFTPLDETLVTDHEVELTDLRPCTIYHYRVISKDRSGNEAISEEDTFTTLGTPATFKLSALSISPAEVGTGESITISVLVTNTGDGTGTDEVTLKLGDVAVAIEEVTLAGGASEKVTFITSADVAGTYIVTVDGQSGTVGVRAPPLAPAPAPTPPVPPPVAPPTPEAPINWPLIGGIIAGCIAAGLLGYFRVWRKRGVSRST